MGEEKRVSIKAAKQLKAIMAQHFYELDEAVKTKSKKSPGVPVSARPSWP